MRLNNRLFTRTAFPSFSLCSVSVLFCLPGVELILLHEHQVQDGEESSNSINKHFSASVGFFCKVSFASKSRLIWVCSSVRTDFSHAAESLSEYSKSSIKLRVKTFIFGKHVASLYIIRTHTHREIVAYRAEQLTGRNAADICLAAGAYWQIQSPC